MFSGLFFKDIKLVLTVHFQSIGEQILRLPGGTRYRLARPRLPINSIILASRRQYAIFWANSLPVFIRLARSLVVNDSSPSGRKRSQSADWPNERWSKTC